MTLRKQQVLFTQLVARLILHAYELGYEVTLAEAWRPPALADLYASQGRGIKNSLHCDRLALDINLFRDGQYLTATKAHQPLGEWWESQHPLCRWGGRFNDGNHYSMEWQGRK